jgi:LysR family transcriptional regulator, carnitine catabolism transcriptional activator
LTGMVEAGFGISLLPALSCPTPALRSVTTRPLARPNVFRHIAFELPSDREPMSAVQAFVRIALDFLTSKPEQADYLQAPTPAFM